MKKILVVIFLIVFLGALVIYEEINVNSSLNWIYEKAIDLQAYTIDAEHINTTEVLARVENIHEEWKKYENRLCFLINHKNIQDMSTQMIYMKSYVSSDDYEDFTASLALVVHYTDLFRHLIGVSVQGIF